MDNNELIRSVVLLVSGFALFMPYKLISAIAKELGKFGDDKEGKLEVAKMVLSAQGGGCILFYGCYIVMMGVIIELLELPFKGCFGIFLVIGGIVSALGLFLIWKALKLKEKGKKEAGATVGLVT